jgi:CoA:oxalate CoA-transferase
MSIGVLDGVRVIDMTHAFAGPFCTYQLALLGADVVKIERPGGDDFRARPEVFASINSGKRSVTIDLSSPDDHERFLNLVEGADVFVHNLRPDVPGKFGIDWPTLEERNPKLVYVAISGYGEGPLRDRAAIEWAVQASSGLMHEFIEGAAPRPATWYPGISIVDPIAGYTAFTAILAALLERERTGQGQLLDIAMMDATLSLMSQYVANDVLEGPSTFTLGARLRTADDLLFVAMSHQRWFEEICIILGAGSIPLDPKFATNEGRTANYQELILALEQHSVGQPAEHWEQALGRRGVPAAAVKTWAQTVKNPSVVSRELFREVSTPSGPGFANAGGFRMATQPNFLERELSVPAAGEHTKEIFAELTRDRIQRSSLA